jgi:hypothetical protein
MKTRSSVQCLHRWTKILIPGLTKGPWVIEEDKKLIEWVRVEGPNKWSQCAEYIPGRSGKQCRERWFNTLNPHVKKGDWSIEEDYNIFNLFSVYGSKWSKIALSLPGRTENSIKNRFYSTLRRIASNYKNRDEDDKNKSLESLLKYYPEAFEEKKKLFFENKPDLEYELIGKKWDRSHFSTIKNEYTSSKTEHSVEELEQLIHNYPTNSLINNICEKEGIYDSNNECIKLLLGQLNQLESILLNTKRQLVNLDTKPEESKIDSMFKFEI